jgi:hypothetical protein
MPARALNPIEHVFAGPGSQPITFAFSYAADLDADLLGRGLTDVLRSFPRARGTLAKVSADELGLEPADAGVVFDVTRSDAAFDRSTGAEKWVRPVSSLEGEPLTRVTLTRTPAGSVLAVSMSHALVDGFSYFHFLSSWARRCRGDRILEPSMDGEALRPAATASVGEVSAGEVLGKCGLFCDADRSGAPARPGECESYFVSDAEIGSHGGPSLSQNDVVAALLWKKHLGAWAEGSGNPVTYLTCPVDVRRLTPGLSRTYFGCALCFATSAIDLAGLRSSTVGDLALRVKEAVHRVRGPYVSASMATLDGLRRRHGLASLARVHLRHPRHGLIVTNLTRMPMGDVDFGSGPPRAFSTYVEVRGGAAILPAEGGVQVLVVPPAAG